MSLTANRSFRRREERQRQMEGMSTQKKKKKDEEPEAGKFSVRRKENARIIPTYGGFCVGPWLRLGGERQGQETKRAERARAASKQT